MIFPINAFNVINADKSSCVLALTDNKEAAQRLRYSSFTQIVLNRGCANITFIKFLGLDFGLNLECITNEQARTVNTRTSRNKFMFCSYLKQLYHNFCFNPINVGTVTIDAPYIYINNNLLCEWFCLFEDNLNSASFKLENNGTVLKYEYTEPIFILKEDTKRHIAVENSEILLINLLTGVVTRSCKKANSSFYYEQDSVCCNGVWSIVKNNRVSIAGYKSRR